MLYAKIVTGLAVEGEFDYIVPPSLVKAIKIGVRARVNFGNKEIIGYVVGLSDRTNIKKLKAISELIDVYPVLDGNMLSLAKSLADYYCCTWGEVIETALPQDLRKGRRLADLTQAQPESVAEKTEITLLHDLDGKARWEVYQSYIENTLAAKRKVIILLPDVASVLEAKERIFSLSGIRPGVLYRKQPKELQEWLSIRNDRVSVVVGTRSAIFAPLSNLGLVIIDAEDDPVYKQDQVPHYNAVKAAFMRVGIEKAGLILGSCAPSLESYYLKTRKKIKYELIPGRLNSTEIKIIDSRLRPQNSRHKRIFSKYLEDSIASVAESAGKTLLFLNRKGFATYASCLNCGSTLKCPRCSVNLVYHFKENTLKCHYCNYRGQMQKICPDCKSGYIHYLGAGTQKLESELSRIFPQARIKLLETRENLNLAEADIFIATEAIIRGAGYNFDLIGVISIDNSLNRVDFRSSEKTFRLLSGLLPISGRRIIMETALPRHLCFSALEKKDVTIFYEEELRQRKLHEFPPYKHICFIKLRGKKEERVKETSELLFDKLRKLNTNKNIEFFGVNPAWPLKLRARFCWQILAKTNSCQKLSLFLKRYLKSIPHSGIIVTVDMDPV